MGDENTLISDDQIENTFDSSNDTIIDNSDPDLNELSILKAEVHALKLFITEQLYLLKKSVGSPKIGEYDTSNDLYIKSLNEQILLLKEENNAKNHIIQSLMQQYPSNLENNRNIIEINDINPGSSSEKPPTEISPKESEAASKINENEDNDKDNNKDKQKQDVDESLISKEKRNITFRRSKKFKKDKKSPDGHEQVNNRANADFQTNRNNTDKSKRKKRVFIIGDSMIKKVNGFLLTRNINHKFIVKVRSFPGAKVKCMTDYVKPTINDFDPEHIIIHVGTNDLNSERTASQIANSIINLQQSLKSINNTVTISLIVPRNDELNNKAHEVNNRLVNMCKERNISYIDHSETILRDRHLNESNLHLNRYGTLEFAKNFSKYLCESD